MPRGERARMRLPVTPSSCLLHEIQRFPGQREPSFGRSGGKHEPLAHRLAFARIEVRALAGFDQLVDPLARKLQHELAAHDHPKYPTANLELTGRSEALSLGDVSDARIAGHFLHQVCVSRLRGHAASSAATAVA